MTKTKTEDKPVEAWKPGLFDFIGAISETKRNLLEEDPTWIKLYDPYMVQIGLSLSADTIFFVNALNEKPSLPKKMHFDFLFSMVPARKRRAPWVKKLKKSEDELVVARSLGISVLVARQYMPLLTEAQIKDMADRLVEGGRKGG